MSAICWLTRRRLGAYRDGELSPGVQDKTARHLDRCPGCAEDLAGLGRLQAMLRASAAPAASEPADAVWQAFWPQVRERLASPPPRPRRSWARLWSPVGGHPRLAFGSALAAAALAVLAVLAPWQDVGVRQVPAPSPSTATSVPGAPVAGTAADHVMVQSVETSDPGSSVMVFRNPETDVTVVWVFGLKRTDI